MVKPKVSVIVPVYKVEQFIERCIRSVQVQTFNEWELILVDDCSPDGCFDIISKYAKDDPRIIVKRYKENHGPMIARRWGDELAKGDYITYCDGDDTLPENALMNLYNAAKYEDADVVIGKFSVVDTKGNRKDANSYITKICDGEDLLRAMLKHKVPQTLCGKLFKSEIIGGHTYKVIDHMTNAEDAYMLYQMIPYIHTVVNLDNVVYEYIQNSASSSQRRYSENALENIMYVNSLRISMVEKYPALKKDILCFVSDVLNGLLIEGYDKDGTLQKLLERHQLQDYLSDKVIVSSHSMIGAIKLLIRKHVLSR